MKNYKEIREKMLNLIKNTPAKQLLEELSDLGGNDFTYSEIEYSHPNRYIVIHKTNLADLMTTVEAYMEKGWTVQGGVSCMVVGGDIYCHQALVGVKE